MKSVIEKYYIVFLFLALLGFSCTSKTTVKIGFITPNLVDDRWPKDRDIFVAKAQQLGGEVLTADGQNDDQRQIRLADELMDKGIKVLVLVPVNRNSAAAIVRSAHKNNVKVIAYERIIANCDLDYFVSFDNVKVGEMMARYAMKSKSKGNYFLLCGDKSDQNAIWVKQGYMNVINPAVNSGDIKIVYDSFTEDWSGDNAYQDVVKYLNLSEQVPDAILSSYDGMSTGAINALDNCFIRLSEYPIITGQNAELQACKNIVSGRQSMTVYKPIKLEAEQAAELALKCAKYESIDKALKTSNNGSIDVPSLLIDPIVVDANNMRTTVIADGFLKEQDVFGR